MSAFGGVAGAKTPTVRGPTFFFKTEFNMITNRFEAVSCQACGRKVKRKSRQQRFCSDRCRDFSRRENKARTAIKIGAGYVDSAEPTNPPKISNETNGLQRAKTGSSIPLNLLGGYRWRSAVSVNPAVLRTIIHREIGDALASKPAGPQHITNPTQRPSRMTINMRCGS